MAGIAEALVATGVGLFVAIPAVVAYNVAQKRVGEVEDHVRALGRLLTAWVATRDRADELAARERPTATVPQPSRDAERVLARAAE